jgi:hypothetical protein
MAQQIINIGSGENEGDGGNTRLAFEKINSNFDELYAGTVQTLSLVGTTLSISGGNQVTLDNVFEGGLTADVTGSIFADNSSMIVNGVDGTLVYTPTTPADWSGDAPTTVGEAIDRLATVVKALNAGTGA